jgi:16S rRNA (cytidine1402-2'-O)-methyltransferase
MATGTLYLVPTPLDFGCDAAAADLSAALPAHTVAVAADLTHWITENAKSTRAFLKRVALHQPLALPLQEQTLLELPRAVHKKGDHTAGQKPGHAFDARPLLAAALQGHDMGLVSEAGMPAIADPGSSVVRAAHALGVPVVPLVGPVSLVLALAASGLNGQDFAFVGYLPQDAGGRAQRIRGLEALAGKTGQTQLCIETPYRNAALLQALVATLQPGTRLALACGLTLATQQVRSAPVADWRRAGNAWASALPLDLPTVFLFGP